MESVMIKAERVRIILPNREETILEAPPGSSLRELKFKIELKFGIPCEIQYLSAPDGGHHFQEWLTLEQCEEQLRGEAIQITVDLWWNKLIIAALNGDIGNVYRRVLIPMQQISKEERCFTSALIASAKKNTTLLQRLITTENVSFTRSTRSGRTLFHIGARAGSEEILSLLLEKSSCTSSREIITRDVMGESALDIATKNRYASCVELISNYLTSKGNKKEISSQVFTQSNHDDKDPETLQIHPQSEEILKADGTFAEEQDEKAGNEENSRKIKIGVKSASNCFSDNDTVDDSDYRKHVFERASERNRIKAEIENDVSNKRSVKQLLTTNCQDNDSLDSRIQTDNNVKDNGFITHPNNLPLGPDTGSDKPENTENNNSTKNNRSSSSNSNSRSSSSNSNDSNNNNSSSNSKDLGEEDSVKHPETLISAPKPLLSRRNFLQGRVSPLCLPIINLEKTPEETDVDGFQFPEINCFVPVSLVNKSSKDSRNRKTNEPCVMTTNKTLPSPPHEPIGVTRSQSLHHRRASAAANLHDRLRHGSLKVIGALSNNEGDISNSRSAPNSPKLRRSTLGGSQSVPTSPKFRRSSLPLAPKSPTTEQKYEHKLPTAEEQYEFREIGIFGKQRQRKSQSVCEGNHAEYLYWLEHIQEHEERTDLPWNVWKSVKKPTQGISDHGTPESALSSPTHARRKSFDVWFVEKEMQKFRELQSRHDDENAPHEKHLAHGKTYEEWLEDKRNEENIGKHNDAMDQTIEKIFKERRRRESKAKYEKWLKDKDIRALEQDKKALEQEEKLRLEAEKRWEEIRQKREEEILKLESRYRKKSLVRTHSNPNH